MEQVQLEQINLDYEYIQYNEKLRIIHSIKDDYYQLKSIIKACNSNKDSYDWFRSSLARELLEEINQDRKFTALKNIYEKRDNLPNNLRGYYVHKLLVNHIAIWASPKYSYYIMKLLDNYFDQERNKQQKIIDDLKPRAVPENNKHDYKYLIYKESINKLGFIRLHLTRRHNSTFRKVANHYQNEEERFFYKDNLPISMTPNINIKDIVKKTFGLNDYTITNSGTAIDIRIEHLPRLYYLIDEYFKQNM